MTDTRAAGRPAEASVGDEGDAVAESHAHNGGGGIQHLPHTGTALGAFVADDDHVARYDLPAVDRRLCFLFGIKYLGGALVYQHFGKYRRPLDHTALGGQIALEHRDTARFAVRIFHGANDLGIQIDTACNVLTHGPTRDGHAVRMEKVLFGQLVHDRIDTARLVQILHIGAACGGEMAEVGRDGADLIGNIEI